jgi:hypothetical protein
MSVSLPAAFADLLPFAEKWALVTEYERSRARRASTPVELQQFYDKMKSRISDVLKVLDQYPLGQIPETHRPLMHMALSLAEIAPNVEFYKLDPKVPHAFDEDRFLSRHGNAQI